MLSLAQLLDQLEPDPWRKEAAFSKEVAGANTELYCATTDQARARILGQWLEKYQPCLFGRIAAKLGLISYCFLTDSDLAMSDDAIREKIQRDRTAWTRDGYQGAKSAFVLVAVSERIAGAIPSPLVKDIAKRLCSLYLLDDCGEDRILYDDIFLEKPGNARVTWKWKTGVNYFSTQGDGRWWTDHRMPGGVAFSVNSVGHMVKSGRLKEYMEKLNADLGVTDEAWNASRVDSLPKALILAMKTIANAAATSSGKATELLPVQEIDSKIRCPVDLPPDLQGKSHCVYRGHYHTDYTIPSEYFIPNVARPQGTPEHRLDLTYMFDDRTVNPAHVTMGEGQRTRGPTSDSTGAGGRSQRGEDAISRIAKAQAEEVAIESDRRLLDALGA
ncbi:MAG: hypothetical protein GC162_14235 [Planctomycetes bacterium]|nr:hypothetical protein [Planctomycetota bacterium]